MQIFIKYRNYARINFYVFENSYGEVTTWVKEKPQSGDFTNGVLNSYHYLIKKGRMTYVNA